MKILLVAINARFTHSNLALRYLRAYAENFSDDVTLDEFTINQNIDDILFELVNIKPDIICFSVYIWNTELVHKILPAFNSILPDCKIVLGGPEVSYNASSWISQFPFISYIISNGGEAGFELLLQSEFDYSKQIISISNYVYDSILFPYKDLEFPELNKLVKFFKEIKTL